MNQILSVEAPREKKSTKTRQKTGGTNTKSAITFFCIILILFGVALIGVAIFSNTGKNEEVIEQPIADSKLIKIGVSQALTNLEVEIKADNGISKIEYSWSGHNKKEIKKNGETSTTINIDIPSGKNTLKIIVTDIIGEQDEYTEVYTGAEEPNVTSFTQDNNKLTITVKEEKTISSVVYYYDQEEEKTLDIGSNEAKVEFDKKEGEHDFTLKVVFQDKTIKQVTQKIFIPVIKIEANGEGGINLTATDTRIIKSVKINLNDEETIENVNNNQFSKKLELVNQENRLIVIVENEDGFSNTKKTIIKK